ncbi:glycosyl hydrolase family 43 protein [Verticillium alfalfae VaMs.102]|uniref:Glycosyl hydrolase family 43 protein n=1 Tax=Verticillium alfalfae (strain VaMs.102 / ATCC MYA-4576 / FGSC 10136) TaxID=526221 RepID=C9S938_VERA1|nr:glycosyl hydrolase family 43 protein [Verticillium alfalfae VaMs.102]EEY14086.1 glycosyl hydrolase family 43 protein [Verticillium alfalfae VaMs.102]
MPGVVGGWHKASWRPPPSRPSSPSRRHPPLRLRFPCSRFTPTKPPARATSSSRRIFPDPCILQDDDGLWYSFATNSGGRNVQAAVAPDSLGPWTYLDGDAMPDHSWTSGATRGRRRPAYGQTTATFFSFRGELPDADGRHCVGVALADSMTGPYRPMPEPWACHLDQGGAIDPAGFHDAGTGRRYVVYKVDGNHDGNGGDCGNSVDPVVSTPIMLQEVGPDGFTKIGNPVQILDRTEADGPLVEAPDIVRLEDGTYVLFFSSWCYASDKYNINYAVSRRVEGPYIRSLRPLLQTGDYGLIDYRTKEPGNDYD